MERGHRGLKIKEASASEFGSSKVPEGEVRLGSGSMERGLRDLKIKEASASEGGDYPKGNDEAFNFSGLLATKATLTGAEKTREGEVDASASEVGKILKLKKEAMLTMATEEDTQSVKTLKKRRKIVKQRLPTGFLEFLAARPYKPVGDLSEEMLAKRTPQFCKWYATKKAQADKFREYQQALVNQYLANGYAEDEFEVSEEEEN
ncbi:unnamed protein product [Urochloa humidicola]